VKAAIAPMLVAARSAGYAVAACNVYTLDQARGVVIAAEEAASPLILQVHPNGVGPLLWPLVAGLRSLADEADVPVGLQLDHSADRVLLSRAVGSGVDAIMADGSDLSPDANARLVAEAAHAARAAGLDVEAEMGRLSGSEDGATVEARAARLTDPDQVSRFLERSGATMLAVSIGNVHGSTEAEPTLDLDRLRAIAARTDVPLVLHGGSGLSDGQLRAAIGAGISKVNVNTELRQAFRDALASSDRADELVRILGRAQDAVRVVTRALLERLGSIGEEERLVGRATR
jgi:tagatose 1,6-diphosphate aldolase GatY/KbaY